MAVRCFFYMTEACGQKMVMFGFLWRGFGFFFPFVTAGFRIFLVGILYRVPSSLLNTARESP